VTSDSNKHNDIEHKILIKLFRGGITMEGFIYKHSPYLHHKSRCSIHNYWKKTTHRYTHLIVTMPFSYTP